MKDTSNRRDFFRGAAAAGTGAALAGQLGAPVAAAADGGPPRHRSDLSPPRPIPGGLQIPGGPFIHVFAPGDPTVTLPFTLTQLQGFDVEPTAMTDWEGFFGVAYHLGRARGADGREFDLETDVRAFRGTYVAEDGTRRRQSFAFI